MGAYAWTKIKPKQLAKIASDYTQICEEGAKAIHEVILSQGYTKAKELHEKVFTLELGDLEWYLRDPANAVLLQGGAAAAPSEADAESLADEEDDEDGGGGKDSTPVDAEQMKQAHVNFYTSFCYVPVVKFRHSFKVALTEAQRSDYLYNIFKLFSIIKTTRAINEGLYMRIRQLCADLTTYWGTHIRPIHRKYVGDPERKKLRSIDIANVIESTAIADFFEVEDGNVYGVNLFFEAEAVDNGFKGIEEVIKKQSDLESLRNVALEAYAIYKNARSAVTDTMAAQIIEAEGEYLNALALALSGAFGDLERLREGADEHPYRFFRSSYPSEIVNAAAIARHPLKNPYSEGKTDYYGLMIGIAEQLKWVLNQP